jgi:hypothetical protein
MREEIKEKLRLTEDELKESVSKSLKEILKNVYKLNYKRLDNH